MYNAYANIRHTLMYFWFKLFHEIQEEGGGGIYCPSV